MKRIIRQKLLVRGIVQGVGFRPFVYRLAVQLNLKGWIANTAQGVEIQIEGETKTINKFLNRLTASAPSLSQITGIQKESVPVLNDREFVIRSSLTASERTTLISPDIGICEDCLNELFDPEDRRYRYPFINCTNCGPRFTIIKDVPYDRPNTTMAEFQMCPDCLTEYKNPENRRFHAQPNACPVCGPRVTLMDAEGQSMRVDDPLGEAVRLLKDGRIVAIKGLGGFHLACDATLEDAVHRLRDRKHREEKPLAVMAPDLNAAQCFAKLSSHEKDLLLLQRRPIVLLKKKYPNPLAESVAPANQFFGTMLPYTPLHYLLLWDNFTALVMTSGNISDEPIAIDNKEAISRLKGIADYYIVHDRRIHLRCDDSVMGFIDGLPRFYRRSRGFVPVPVFLRESMPDVLAVGGELKNTVCLIKGERAFPGQHVGDLENAEALHFLKESIVHLCDILQVQPKAIAHDLHPDYLSTKWALDQHDAVKIGVQHHHAHIASCLAENGREEKVIGLSLDGTGYGSDGCIWGGEVLLADFQSFERVGHFVYRPMPGGTAAIKEPWRMAVSYLYYAGLHAADREAPADWLMNQIKKLPLNRIESTSIQTVIRMMESSVNTVMTSSLGRLFDAAASISGLRHRVAFEGQAAMEFEMSIQLPDEFNGEFYGFDIIESDDRLLFDMDPVILRLAEDVIEHTEISEMALRFHRGVVRHFHRVCDIIRKRTGIGTVALSGGCFQNHFLLAHLSRILKKSGFDVLTHSQVPTNDGGLALGQAVIAARRMAGRK